MSERGKAGVPAGGAFLSIKRLTKKFGQFVALDDISLEIENGEFVCFLGPSGCGKTTLLRAIAGLDIQSSGLVEQAGRDISALPPSERDFGIVFQSYALFPNLTVTKNVAYGLENRKRSRSEINARVTELLELVGLPDQGAKYPAQLSGGQQQRIALARAIASSPGLLLLDEPLSALDAKVRGHLRHEIKELQRKLGVTTIMVTHDQEEALTMADRIVVMNQGVIEQVGSPVEIYREPATAFVADFIGSMNFLPAKVVGKDRIAMGGIDLDCPSGDLAPGTVVTLAVRPEDLPLLEEGAEGGGAGDSAGDSGGGSGGDANVFDVDVLEAEFLGSFLRVTLAATADPACRLTADFPVHVTRGRMFDAGQRLTVALPRDQLRLYPAGVGHG